MVRSASYGPQPGVEEVSRKADRLGTPRSA